ncbi:MAG: type II toxin-antitoxin system VapC family toxin [Trueperaceae bacterium]
MYLLDTDTLTHLYAGHPRVIANLQTLNDPLVTTTIITKAEMLRGRIAFLLKAASGSEVLRAQQLLQRTEALLEELFVIPFDERAVKEFDTLRHSYRKIGHADLLIASITLANRATLVTRNLQHFRQISGLKVINWVD